ncbi:hypothetical protein R3P38DRAFT_2806684 [Favolaschia claudopus]|uniref:Uncharacterized protein n=1 Tax=Favolaschia claudopus TaxID=2862362 RepID=A0AAV9ZJ39_9AGAR
MAPTLSEPRPKTRVPRSKSKKTRPPQFIIDVNDEKPGSSNAHQDDKWNLKVLRPRLGFKAPGIPNCYTSDPWYKVVVHDVPTRSGNLPSFEDLANELEQRNQLSSAEHKLRRTRFLDAISCADGVDLPRVVLFGTPPNSATQHKFATDPISSGIKPSSRSQASSLLVEVEIYLAQAEERPKAPLTSSARSQTTYDNFAAASPVDRPPLHTAPHPTMNLLTPPTTPQRHQQRQREIQRAIRESYEASPRRRRVPAQHDENVPPHASIPAAPNARSLGQLRRHQRARENRPHPPTEPLSNRARAQRARRERERAEKAAMMDVDDPLPNARNSRVLQIIPLGSPDDINLRTHATVHVCGVPSDIDKANSTFDVKAEQYLSATRTPNNVFPIHCVFPATLRWEKYKPIPGKGKSVSVEGRSKFQPHTALISFHNQVTLKS